MVRNAPNIPDVGAQAVFGADSCVFGADIRT